MKEHLPAVDARVVAYRQDAKQTTDVYGSLWFYMDLHGLIGLSPKQTKDRAAKSPGPKEIHRGQASYARGHAEEGDPLTDQKTTAATPQTLKKKKSWRTSSASIGSCWRFHKQTQMSFTTSLSHKMREDN